MLHKDIMVGRNPHFDRNQKYVVGSIKTLGFNFIVFRIKFPAEYHFWLYAVCNLIIECVFLLLAIHRMRCSDEGRNPLKGVTRIMIPRNTQFSM